MRPVSQTSGASSTSDLNIDDSEYEYVWEEEPTPPSGQGPYRSPARVDAYGSAELERAFDQRDGSFEQAVEELFRKGLGVVPQGERMAVMRLLVESDQRHGLAHLTAIQNLAFVPAKARVEVAARLGLQIMRTSPYQIDQLNLLRNFMVHHHAAEFPAFAKRIEQGLVNKTLLKAWDLLVAPGDDKAPGFGLLVRLPVYLALLAALPLVSAMRLIPAFDKAYRFFRRDSSEARARLFGLDTLTRTPADRA